MSWVQRVTEKGHTYYENLTTGESRLGKPLGYGEDVDTNHPTSLGLGSEALVNLPVGNDGDDEPDKCAESPPPLLPPPPLAVSLTDPTSLQIDLDGDADQCDGSGSTTLVTGDIEMGNVASNPLHEKGKLEKEESIKAFSKAVKKEAARAARKGLGGAVGAKQGVNTEALGRFEGGGGSLERLTIAINWAQNFGLVMVFDVAWPESFKKWFKWIEMLGLDFDVFGGMGEDVSIALGLLVPVWLVWEFDAGLFWERTYYVFFFMGTDGDNFNLWDLRRENHVGGDQPRWWRELNVVSPLLIMLGFKGFAALILGAAVFVAFAFASVAVGWITNDLANAFILVLSGLSLLSFLHQVYLWRETKVCELAKEDFAKKRQENQMLFFLFFYTVAYLSGVSACTKLLIAEETAEKIVGGILLPFYVLVPLWKLHVGAASVKTAVKEASSVEGHKYKELKTILGGTGTDVIGRGQVSTYKESLGLFGKKAADSKINEHLTRSSSGGGN
ncbi:hypothetical protein TrST_g373 [Triparma strigata]|uniref:Uncharacterized protein n=1 Tax=Triparma strigata TaxID=1606541 RepID=A0A9W7E045_9STRA|nr:hypothetical protein TrST_g373 [Triparma strigata]